MNVQLMYALGEAKTVFRLDLIKKGFGLVVIAGGATFGLHGVAWAAVVVGIFASAVNGRVAGRELGFGTLEQLRSVFAPITLALVIALPAGLAAHWWSATPLVELAVLGLSGAVAYLVLARLLNITAVMEAFGLLRQLKEREPA
jgi:hypothetical protein